METKKRTRLDDSYKIYEEIIEKDLPDKFKLLDLWLYNKSQKLLFETKIPHIKFGRYPRGTIVKLDFGVNVGTEFSLPHFAIVISKSDTFYNDLLTVVPLTSKNHGNHTMSLGSLIIDAAISCIENNMDSIKKDMELLTGKVDEAALWDTFTAKMADLKLILDTYKNYEDLSNACIDQVQSISKLRLLKPINEYDIIGCKCPDDIMEKIDFELVKKYTGFDYRDLEKKENDN